MTTTLISMYRWIMLEKFKSKNKNAKCNDCGINEYWLRSYAVDIFFTSGILKKRLKDT